MPPAILATPVSSSVIVKVGAMVSTTKVGSGLPTAPVRLASLPWASLMVAPFRLKAVTARSAVF